MFWTAQEFAEGLDQDVEMVSRLVKHTKSCYWWWQNAVTQFLKTAIQAMVKTRKQKTPTLILRKGLLLISIRTYKWQLTDITEEVRPGTLNLDLHVSFPITPNISKYTDGKQTPYVSRVYICGAEDHVTALISDRQMTHSLKGIMGNVA